MKKYKNGIDYKNVCLYNKLEQMFFCSVKYTFDGKLVV